MPLHRCRIVGSENDARHLVTNKIRNELLQTLVAVKIDLIVDRRIIMQDFRRNLVLGAAAHDDFKDPHGRTIIRGKLDVQSLLNWNGSTLITRFFI